MRKQSLEQPRISIAKLVFFGAMFSPMGQSFAAPDVELKIETMAAYFQQLRARHPVFQLGADQVQIEAHQRESYLGAKDWIFDADAGINHFQTIQVNESPNEVDQLSGGLGLSRAIWETGGRVSMQWDLQRNRLNYPAWQGNFFQAGGRSHENVLSLNYVHPLLKNSHGTFDRTDYDAGNFVVQAAAVNAREQEESFLLTAGLEFVDWVLLEEQTRILRRRIDLSGEQIAQIKKKRATNLVNKVDVLRAEDSQRNTVQNLVFVEAQRDSQRNKLAEMLTGEGLASTPQFDLYRKQALPSVVKSYKYLIERSRTAAYFALQLAELERRKEGVEDQTSAELSLIFGVALKGGGYEMRDTFDLNKQDASVGLHFSQPLGNRTATHQLKKITVQIHELALQRGRALIDMRAQAAELTTRLQRLDELLDLNKQHIQSAKNTTAEELRLYNQGRNDLATVILSQDREQLARVNYANNAATYHRSLLQLKALLDELAPEPTPESGTSASLFTGAQS